MNTYKHTQIGYLMIVITLAVLVFFAWLQITVRAEPPSPDSGANFAITAIMALTVFILGSFATLTVVIDKLASPEPAAQGGQFLKLRFGWGVFQKKFLLSEVASVRKVKNHWYYGWGIRLWFWPYMWIYNVSGFDAVEITMKNNRIYRIGTNEPEQLEAAIRQAINI